MRTTGIDILKIGMPGPVTRLLDGAPYTFFQPKDTTISLWIMLKNLWKELISAMSLTSLAIHVCTTMLFLGIPLELQFGSLIFLVVLKTKEII